MSDENNKPQKIDWNAPIHYKPTSNSAQGRAELEYKGVNNLGHHMVSIVGSAGLKVPYDDYGFGVSEYYRRVYNEDGYVKPKRKRRLKLEPFGDMGIF